MTRVMVTALGSGHGDDSVGWLVASQLQARLATTLPVRIITCDRTGMEWLYQLHPEESLYLVDAVVSGGVPGTIVHFPNLHDLPMTRLPYQGSHGLTIPSLFALAQTLRLLPSKVEFWGIEIADVGPGMAMETKVLTAVDALVDRLCTNINHELRHAVCH